MPPIYTTQPHASWGVILLDLFSGIGCMHLGAIQAGLDFDHTYYSEIDPYAVSVYTQEFPRSTPLGDITKIDRRRIKDLRRRHPKATWVVTAGFPCTQISPAGNGKGLAGKESRLWFEALRVIGSLRPAVVLIENVPLLRSRGLDQVLLGLSEAGLDSEWTTASAGEFGAPHVRERLFVVAYPGSSVGGGLPGQQEEDEEHMGEDERIDREAQEPGPWPERARACATGTLHGRPGIRRMDDGPPDRVYRDKQRLRGLGNSVVPQVVASIFKKIIRAGLLR